MKFGSGSRASSLLLTCAVAAALPLHAGVSYRVTAEAKTTTLVRPHPRRVDTQRPRWTVSPPMQVTAEVFVEGPNIRIDHFRLDDGRGGGTRNSPRGVFISRDGGASFELEEPPGNTRKFPLELSFNPAAMTMLSFSRILGAQASRVQVDRRSEGDGGMVGGYSTRRHEVRARFDLEADARLRRPRMKVISDHEVWFATAIPERVPAGLHAWATGFAPIDAAVREKVRDAQGFPLKSITRLQMESGQTHTSTLTTLEITDIRIGPLHRSLFELNGPP